VQNITEQLFEPADWDDFELETMHSVWYNKTYFGWFQSDNNEGYISIDTINGSITTGVDYHQAAHVTLLDGKLRTIFQSGLANPALYYISQWDVNPEAFSNFQYKSNRTIVDKPHNLKVAQVVLDLEFYQSVLDAIGASGGLEAANEDAWNETDFADMLMGPINGSPINYQDWNGDTLFSLANLGVSDFVVFNLYESGVLKFSKEVRSSKMFKLPRGYKGKQWEVELKGMITIKRVTLATSTEEIV
jgi:hypothetical protein